MPCRDGGPDPYTESKIRLDAATKAACEMARFIRRATNSFSKLTDETKDWVRDHDKADAARIKREQEEKDRKELKKRALKKLTPEERKALNIRS